MYRNVAVDRNEACEMNVHKRCEKSGCIPKLCGADHTERRGRIHLKIKYSEKTSTDGELEIEESRPMLGKISSVVLELVTFETMYEAFLREAKNLIPMDPTGLSDPYVKVKLKPDPEKETKKKTPIMKKNLNPVWNQKYLFKIAKQDLDRRLSVEVWDWDRATANDFMGSMSFGVSELIKNPVEGWFKLLNREEGEFYNVPIQDDIGTALAELRKKFKFLKPKEDDKIEPTETTQPVGDISSLPALKPDDFTFLKLIGKGSFGKAMTTSFPRVSVVVNRRLDLNRYPWDSLPNFVGVVNVGVAVYGKPSLSLGTRLRQ
eukprot:Seg460.4 transcript_id=Seg460.4/GoldUCD/mRNA.D3Y31 product="Protein kinase C alpha type" protein_id=Seg460.4/GoldUCD/D3Y31